MRWSRSMNHRLAAALSALAMIAAPVAATAQVGAAGAWSVSGKVSTLAFTLDCRFTQSGQTLGGVCVDRSTSDPKVKGGRSHTLTSGSVDGDQVRWSYQSSFLFTHFTVAYEGVRHGDAMTGSIDAQGHSGTFTAHRRGS
jgi:hypothetical protein